MGSQQTRLLAQSIPKGFKSRWKKKDASAATEHLANGII
jgi:hypothetical protein